MHSAWCWAMSQLAIPAAKLIIIICVCGVPKITRPWGIKGIRLKWTFTVQCREAKSTGRFTTPRTLSVELTPWICCIIQNMTTRSAFLIFTGVLANSECHGTIPLNWESWSCRWRVAEVASSLSRPHSVWLPYTELHNGKSVCATLVLDIDKPKVKITSAIETVERNMLEGVWDKLDWIFVGSRMDITWSIFRVRKTFSDCHLFGTITV
jgi:hypothetical protein